MAPGGTPEHLKQAVVAHLGYDPESAVDPFYVVDPAGRIVYCNQAFAELVGEPRRDRIVGQLSLLLYPPEFTPVILMRRIEGLLGRRETTAWRAEIRCGGGGTVPVDVLASSVKRGDEVLGRVVRVRRTDQPAPSPAPYPQVESLLHLSREEADALPYGLILLDRDGVVIGYNEAESRMSGYTRSQVIGRNFFAEVAPCTRVRGFGGLYRQMVQATAPPTAQFEFVFRLPQGERRVSILMAYFRPQQQGVILVDQPKREPA